MLLSPKRSVLITGASSGFGKRFVEAFLHQGWQVYVGLRGGEKRFREVYARELTAHPEWAARAIPLDLHVDRAESVHAAAARIAKDGSLDSVVHNAGYALMGALEDQTIPQIRDQMETNFLGAVALTQALLPSLRARRGRILVISSAAGLTGLPYYAAYSASKYALEGYFEALSYELRPDGISVCLVEPGTFRTWTELGEMRMGERVLSGRNKDLNQRFIANIKAQYKASPDPAPVARLLVKLAERRNVPMRVVVGRDAWGLRFLQLLPSFLYHHAFYWGFKQSMLKAR